MKKTFLAVLIAGGSMAAFAQTTPTTPTTTPTKDPTTTTNSTSDPIKTTTNAPMNNTNATTTTSASWNSVTAPSWGWNNHGIWDNSANMNTGATGNLNGTTNSNVNGNVTDANLNSTGAYNAYGTSVAALPPNVQMRFDKEYPNTTGTAYTWNQYGDWFHSHYINNGRLTQYYYDMRGNGYSLALPVIQTYVPEEIIDKALQKYGSGLYSISMVKTAEGKDAYQLGLLERGQMRMEYLNEDGTSVASVWRTEEDLNATGTMTATDANAALDAQNNTTTTDEKETKTKWKKDGMKTKIKSGDGKVKVKQKKVDD